MLPHVSARKRESLEEAFGAVLRQHRIEADLAQEALAEAADMSRVGLSLLERGHRCPSLRTVFQLARALGTPPSALVRDVERRLGL